MQPLIPKFSHHPHREWGLLLNADSRLDREALQTEALAAVASIQPLRNLAN